MTLNPHQKGGRGDNGNNNKRSAASNSRPTHFSLYRLQKSGQITYKIRNILLRNKKKTMKLLYVKHAKHVSQQNKACDSQGKHRILHHRLLGRTKKKRQCDMYGCDESVENEKEHPNTTQTAAEMNQTRTKNNKNPDVIDRRTYLGTGPPKTDIYI